MAAEKKTTTRKLKFKTNEFVVYPAHGVGRIVNIEEQEIAGASLELYVIDFDKEKMRLRVPTGKSEAVGMRKLSDKALVESALKVLKGHETKRNRADEDEAHTAPLGRPAAIEDSPDELFWSPIHVARRVFQDESRTKPERLSGEISPATSIVRHGGGCRLMDL